MPQYTVHSKYRSIGRLKFLSISSQLPHHVHSTSLGGLLGEMTSDHSSGRYLPQLWSVSRADRFGIGAAWVKLTATRRVYRAWYFASDVDLQKVSFPWIRDGC